MHRAPDTDFWRGKRVFLTGHTGFKGSWLSVWLEQLGATVKGYSVDVPTSPALFEEADVQRLLDSRMGDIRDFPALLDAMQRFDPDVLIHMAAQPLVRLSYVEPLSTFGTNVTGTLHVLEAARQCHRLKAIVNVTTDKCYENQSWEWGYRENEPLGGYDPYSSSKACSELVTSSYRQSFFDEPGTASLASARAGNVIGGGDWALDRLLPDALRAFAAGTPLEVRNPSAIRPWQHVLEPLRGYLLLAESLYSKGRENAEAWNFGPSDDDAKSVEWIVSQASHCWGESAQWHVDSGSHPHEATFLKLDTSKARARLGWTPVLSLQPAIESVVTWHKSWSGGASAYDLCVEEIQTYSASLTAA